MTAEKITASKRCKEAGLEKGTAELSKISTAPVSTLNTWFSTKRQLFEVVLLGAVEHKRREAM